MDGEMRKSRLEKIMLALTSGKLVTLTRVRKEDNAVHQFSFQLHRTKDPKYQLQEHFCNDCVNEEMVDIETILVLCNWLLHLKFEHNIIDFKALQGEAK